MTNLKSEEKLREEWRKHLESDQSYDGRNGQIPPEEAAKEIADWWLGKMAEQRKALITSLEGMKYTRENEYSDGWNRKKLNGERPITHYSLIELHLMSIPWHRKVLARFFKRFKITESEFREWLKTVRMEI